MTSGRRKCGPRRGRHTNLTDPKTANRSACWPLGSMAVSSSSMASGPQATATPLHVAAVVKETGSKKSNERITASMEGAAAVCGCQQFLNPLPMTNGTSHVALQHYCRVCNIQLNSCRQARIHAEGKKHAKRFTYLKMCIEAGGKSEPSVQTTDINNNSPSYYATTMMEPMTPATDSAVPMPPMQQTMLPPMLMMEHLDMGIVANTSYPVYVAATSASPMANGPSYPPAATFPNLYYVPNASQSTLSFGGGQMGLPTSASLPNCSMANCPSAGVECFVAQTIPPPTQPPPPPPSQPPPQPPSQPPPAVTVPHHQTSLLGPPPPLLASTDFQGTSIMYSAKSTVESSVMSPSVTTSGVSSDCCPETSSILSAASYSSSSPGFFPLSVEQLRITAPTTTSIPQQGMLPTPMGLASYPIKSKAMAATKSSHSRRAAGNKANNRGNNVSKTLRNKEGAVALLRCDTCELRVNSTRQLQAHLAGQKHRVRSLRRLQDGDTSTSSSPSSGKPTDAMCDSLLTSKSVSSGAFVSSATTSSDCSSSTSSSSARRRRAMTIAVNNVNKSKSKGSNMMSRHCRSTSSLQKRSLASACGYNNNGINMAVLNKSTSMIISVNREVEDDDDDADDDEDDDHHEDKLVVVDWSNGDSAVEAGSTAANSCNSEEEEEEENATAQLVGLVDAMKPVGIGVAKGMVVKGGEVEAGSASEIKSIPMLNVFFHHLSKKGATKTVATGMTSVNFKTNGGANDAALTVVSRARRRSAGGPAARPPPPSSSTCPLPTE